MALAQHHSVEVRFQQQVENAERYLLPFIETVCPLQPGMRVMEIGCGEGGVLRAFTQRGVHCLGVDLSPSRIETARSLMAEEVASGQADFVVQNVYEDAFLEAHHGEFDLILLKDTIEHIPDQARFIPYLREFLAADGKVFFGFPPWCMPFGGHQQICEHKLLGKLPWIHLLPYGLYRGLLRAFGESDRVVRDLIEIKDTGISLHRFEKILRVDRWQILSRRLYLINPIYRYKFGLAPREQARWIAALPHLRDFFTTAGWYVVQPQARASGKK
ncbi:MAG: methyltransferase domain-containing protein [Bacteroidetes bacterium]|nr:MAG: methyltransferase domain-containing protein [Bacteroidota bacterium]